MTEPVDPMASADEAEIEPTSGSVTFVGSGPGDLGLLTLAGSRAVRFADLIIVDEDADVELVRGYGPAHATVALAGDDEVGVILDGVSRGQKVVRLTRGDYFTDEVALMFTIAGDTLQPHADGGFLGPNAVMDLERDGHLEAVTTSGQAIETRGPATGHQSYEFPYNGCRC